jgi:meso-butanediol dehydrogenase/(S,S)-butanediol dehydrogenase/diacetyl reductase
MDNKKIALVTGSGDGIGRAIALRLFKDGFVVVVNDLNSAAVGKVTNEIERLGGTCLGIVADVSDKGQVDKMFDEVGESFGGIHVLVNNAGICPTEFFADITAESLLRTFSVNVLSVLLCSQAASKYMIRQGCGKIINAASQGAFRQTTTSMAYGCTKWAVRGLTRSLALSLAPYNINVNAYCPGIVDTKMHQGLVKASSVRLGISEEEYLEQKRELIPLGRLQTPDEIAGLVSFLASDSANSITGQNIMINGGQIMN